MWAARSRRLWWTYLLSLACFSACWWFASQQLNSNATANPDRDERAHRLPPWLLHTGHDSPVEQKESVELDEPELELDRDQQGNSNDPWVSTSSDQWALIILFQHNFGILRQAVDGYRRASQIMASNIIIVDNSANKEAVADAALRGMVKDIVATPVSLNFPQLHNFMGTLALQRGYPFYFWAHSDNYVLPMAPGRDLGVDVLTCLRQQTALNPDWGLVLFSYDHLAAFRTQTMIQVPWDPHVFQYGSECDAYGRFRKAGYSAKACKVHLSYDMKRVLNISDEDSYASIKTLLEREKAFKLGRNMWRETSMSQAEQDSRQKMKVASRAYLSAKWGKRGCNVKDLPCSKPWPYCPTCPKDLPYCLSQSVSLQQLKEIHQRVHTVFDEDLDQPVALVT